MLGIFLVISFCNLVFHIQIVIDSMIAVLPINTIDKVWFKKLISLILFLILRDFLILWYYRSFQKLNHTFYTFRLRYLCALVFIQARSFVEFWVCVNGNLMFGLMMLLLLINSNQEGFLGKKKNYGTSLTTIFHHHFRIVRFTDKLRRYFS